MVTISREPIRYKEGWSYKIIAYVPHKWASKKFEYLNGYDASITTADPDYTVISINDTHEDFQKRMVHVITECTALENTSINKLGVQIAELQKQRNALISRNRGK